MNFKIFEMLKFSISFEIIENGFSSTLLNAHRG